MIINEIANITPTAITDKIAGKLKPLSISKPDEVVTSDICICDDCVYIEPVFSEVGAIATWWKNDKTSLLFKKVISTDSIVIKLFKNGIEEAVISDDIYGVYYSSFTNQPLYVGFVACWNKIYNTLGVGQYQFKIEKNILGQVENLESILYQLYVYSDEKAEGTVRIESYNTGTILRSDFDYFELIPGGWYQSYRIKGKLHPKNPKFSTDNYLDADNVRLQIQDKIIDEWILKTELLPAEVSNQIIYDNLLGNKRIISDYNYYNEEIIREKELYFIEIIDKKVFEGQKNCIFELKFTDKIENIIKNNFRL